MKENKHPILSICIPTYNRGYVIEKTINSVCSQPKFSSGEVELIVSDNASTDNTEQIIKDFQKEYNNIKYFRNSSNIGAMKNILRSYSLGTGKYLWCLGSDDSLNQGCIGYTLKAINSFNPDVIIHRNNAIGKSFKNLKNKFFYKEHNLYKFPSQNDYFFFLGEQFALDKNSFDVLESQITWISGYIISSEHFKKSKNNIVQKKGIEFFTSFNFIQSLLVHSMDVDNPIVLFDIPYVGQIIDSSDDYQKNAKKSYDSLGKGVNRVKIYYHDSLFLSKYFNNKYQFNKNTIKFFKSFTNFRKLLYIANIPFFCMIKSIIPLELRIKMGGFIAKYLSK